MDPAFDPDVTSYETTTTNATNTVTATPKDETATVSLILNDEEMTGTTATWEEGENVLEIVVSDGSYPAKATKTYTVTVTAS